MLAQDPLSLAFIFCFLLGFGFFLVTALLGSHGHHGHAGSHAHVSGHAHGSGHAHVSSHAHPAGAYAHVNGHAQTSNHVHPDQQAQTQGQSHQGHFSFFTYLNPTSFGLFLLGFGLFGYVFHNLADVTATASIIFAIAAGIVLAIALLSLLNRVFANAEGSTELDVVDRTGMLGKVSITIPEQGLGEIIYTSPGGVHKSVPARSLNGQRMVRDQEVVVVDYQNGVAEVDTWEHFMHEEGNASPRSTSDELAGLRAMLDGSSPLTMEMLMHQESQKE